jgi:hypothetical protein
MSITNGLDFATALFFAGAFNIITGVTFSIPMAVQPIARGRGDLYIFH